MCAIKSWDTFYTADMYLNELSCVCQRWKGNSINFSKFPHNFIVKVYKPTQSGCKCIVLKVRTEPEFVPIRGF